MQKHTVAVLDVVEEKDIDTVADAVNVALGVRVAVAVTVPVLDADGDTVTV